MNDSAAPAVPPASALHHRLRRMVGRDPEEKGRVATPLELLFDLTFVVAFGIAGNQAAHIIAEGYWAPALIGFGFAMFAIVWAWINFSWFASAFDTDDWFYRVMTMVQMVGVIVLALGLPPMFASLHHGEPLDNVVMVIGYIIMCVALVTQWLRVARQDPKYRSAALTYALFLGLAQIGWVVALIVRENPAAFVTALIVTLVLDIGGPLLAERKGTPWHAHHIAERYALLAIIALGEVVLGTVTSVSAVTEEQGWSAEAILLVIAGVALAFALWWVYYIVPAGEVLHHHRERSFGWGYSHLVLFASIAAIGAGLHVAAYVIEGHAHVSDQQAVLTVAVPVAIFVLGLFVIYSVLMRELDVFHIMLAAIAAVPLGLAVFLAQDSIDVSFGWCLLIMTLSPISTIIGYEWRGHRHVAAMLARQ